MAGQFSDTGSKRALDAVTGRATVTSRTTYLALLTAAPSDATTDGTITMTEYAPTSGYSRQTVTWVAPFVDGTTTQTTTQNTGAITFGPFTGTVTGTITHAALVSATSGTTGDLVAWWQLDNSRTPAANDAITVASGSLVLNVE